MRPVRQLCKAWPENAVYEGYPRDSGGLASHQYSLLKVAEYGVGEVRVKEGDVVPREVPVLVSQADQPPSSPHCGPDHSAGQTSAVVAQEVDLRAADRPSALLEENSYREEWRPGLIPDRPVEVSVLKCSLSRGAVSHGDLPSARQETGLVVPEYSAHSHLLQPPAQDVALTLPTSVYELPRQLLPRGQRHRQPPGAVLLPNLLARGRLYPLDPGDQQSQSGDLYTNLLAGEGRVVHVAERITDLEVSRTLEGLAHTQRGEVLLSAPDEVEEPGAVLHPVSHSARHVVSVALTSLLHDLHCWTDVVRLIIQQAVYNSTFTSPTHISDSFLQRGLGFLLCSRLSLDFLKLTMLARLLFTFNISDKIESTEPQYWVK